MAGFHLRVDGLFMQLTAGEILSSLYRWERSDEASECCCVSLILNDGQTPRMVAVCCHTSALASSSVPLFGISSALSLASVFLTLCFIKTCPHKRWFLDLHPFFKSISMLCCNFICGIQVLILQWRNSRCSSYLEKLFWHCRFIGLWH